LRKDFLVYPASSPAPHHREAVEIPALHIVANLIVNERTRLLHSENFRKFIDDEIVRSGLAKVGEAYHDFPGGGYTAVICLTESHLSIHTWPERNYLTFDVFLSNFLRDNRSTTERLYAAVRKFFNAEVVLEKFIER
jgi:S-adenosylmethionine decarboxylase